jgi:drug/metabolite transporter (DMT)-like permease
MPIRSLSQIESSGLNLAHRNKSTRHFYDGFRLVARRRKNRVDAPGGTQHPRARPKHPDYADETPMQTRDWLLLASLSVLMGGAFFFVAVALSGFGPFTVVLGRFGFAALALLAFLRFRGDHLPGAWRDWRALIVMSLLNNVIPFTLITNAQLRIESGLAAIFNATTPLFTVVLAHFLTHDEKMNPLKLLGIGFGLAGVVVLIGPHSLGAFDPRNIAQIGLLAAAVSYAMAGIYGKRLRHLPSVTAAAGMLVASTLIMYPIAAYVEGLADITATGTALAAVIGLALLSTALAYVIYFRLLATVGATNLLLVTFLIPLTAILLGAVFLGERLDPNAIGGLALIFAGLAAVDGRVFRRLRR